MNHADHHPAYGPFWASSLAKLRKYIKQNISPVAHKILNKKLRVPNSQFKTHSGRFIMISTTCVRNRRINHLQTGYRVRQTQTWCRSRLPLCPHTPPPPDRSYCSTATIIITILYLIQFLQQTTVSAALTFNISSPSRSFSLTLAHPLLSFSIR